MLEAATPALQSFREPVADRLDAVRDRIAAVVDPEFEALERVSDHLLRMKGKLLRPTLLLLCNEVGGDPAPDEEAVTLAAVVEMVHVATLVHDDAVDHSVRRRGMPTVNARWTHQVAIILGDFLYSRAVTEIARLGDVEAIELVAAAANRMTVGEMRQLTSHDALDFDEDDYRLLCECKTASLMATACELGAMFGTPEHREALRGYGHRLGMAFQVTDDLLDYTASAGETGKPTGQDLREHKVTLPLIAALPEMEAAERERVERLFGDPEPPDELVDEVRDLVDRRGGIEAARREAARYVAEARSRLEGLPDGPALRALDRTAEFVQGRRR
mgnify:CR=1 FL=1